MVGIHIPQAAMEYARSLVRQRQRLVVDSTRQKCRIWHCLYFHSLQLPQKSDVGHYWSNKFIKQIESNTCNGDPWLKMNLQLMIKDHQQKRALILETTRNIRNLCRQEPFKKLIELITGIPGIGEVNAAIILFELEDIHRFKSHDHLYSYAGLVPDTDDSGEVKKSKGITHRSNSRLRKALVESSWIIMRKDPAMLMLYKKYCKSMHKNKAIIRIAKHLLSRIRYVLKEQKPYVEAVLK